MMFLIEVILALGVGCFAAVTIHFLTGEGLLPLLGLGWAYMTFNLGDGVFWRKNR